MRMGLNNQIFLTSYSKRKADYCNRLFSSTLNDFKQFF